MVGWECGSPARSLYTVPNLYFTDAFCRLRSALQRLDRAALDPFLDRGGAVCNFGARSSSGQLASGNRNLRRASADWAHENSLAGREASGSDRMEYAAGSK